MITNILPYLFLPKNSVELECKREREKREARERGKRGSEGARDAKIKFFLICHWFNARIGYTVCNTIPG